MISTNNKNLMEQVNLQNAEKWQSLLDPFN